MRKFLVGLACIFSLCLFGSTTSTNVYAAESTNTITHTVRKLQMPEEQKTIYTYSDEGGEYTFTILSETEIQVHSVSPTGEVVELTCTYTLEENLLSLYIGGEVWSQFTVNEDNTLTLYEPEVSEDGETSDEKDPLIDMDLNEEIDNLKLLLEALQAELEAETFNAENLAAILVALGGTLGSILLILLFRLLRTKILNLKNNEEYEKAKQAMADEFAAYQAKVEELIRSLEDKVVKKIDDTEEKRKAHIEAQSMQLSETIEQAKKNLSIDEILNDE